MRLFVSTAFVASFAEGMLDAAARIIDIEGNTALVKRVGISGESRGWQLVSNASTALYNDSRCDLFNLSQGVEAFIKGERTGWGFARDGRRGMI